MSRENRDEYEFSEDVRVDALRRANWRCERCHKAKPLALHHKVPVFIARTRFPHILPEAVGSLDNVMCLCKDCHSKEDRRSRQQEVYMPVVAILEALTTKIQAEIKQTAVRVRQ